jgi:hypothetical protein
MCKFFKRLWRTFTRWFGLRTPAGALHVPQGSTWTDDEKISLLMELRHQLADEMKAVDTRAGIVIALAGALAVATFSGAEVGWKIAAVSFAAVAIAAGVVALLVNTIEGLEPGDALVDNVVSGSSTKKPVEVHEAWVLQWRKALVLRKRWLLAAYTALVVMGASIALAYILKVLSDAAGAN